MNVYYVTVKVQMCFRGLVGDENALATIALGLGDSSTILMDVKNLMMHGIT